MPRQEAHQAFYMLTVFGATTLLGPSVWDLVQQVMLSGNS